MRRLWNRSNRSLELLLIACGLALVTLTASSAPDPRMNGGPYNVTFLEGGVGLTRPLAADMTLLGVRAKA